MYQPLPEDDDALVLRSNTREHGLPAPSTFAKWASCPSHCPIELPYTLIGRQAAYRAGDLRKLRKALTFNHTAEKHAASSRLRSRRGGE